MRILPRLILVLLLSVVLPSLTVFCVSAVAAEREATEPLFAPLP